jgi:hypothetical protein
VIRRYMSDILKPDSSIEKKQVYISEVTVRDRNGEQATFESGQTAWVDVEVTAREAVDKLAVVIWLNDETQYEIFSTSTERLGHGSFSLKPGQTYKCTFELTLNAAHGSFGLCVCIHRYDIQQDYDRRVPAAMLFVGSSMGVRGAVNCFPKVLNAGVVETAKEVVRT